MGRAFAFFLRLPMTRPSDSDQKLTMNHLTYQMVLEQQPSPRHRGDRSANGWSYRPRPFCQDAILAPDSPRL